MNKMIIVASVISIPVSIISAFSAFKANYTVNKLSEIVARQHDINPEKLKKNSERLPFVRRFITITNVEYNSNGEARVYFKDSAIERMIINQDGCPSFGKSIGKKYAVDYNTVKNVYAISCAQTSNALK